MDTRVLIQTLHENARRVEALLAGLSEEEARRAPAPNEWSAFEVLTHMRTSEAIMMPRLLQVLVRPGVRMPDMDEHRRAELLARARLPIAERWWPPLRAGGNLSGSSRRSNPKSWQLRASTRCRAS